MKNNWKIVAGGLLLILIGQIIGVQFGLYEGPTIWFDLLLHFISGVVLAVVWIIISVSKMQTQSIVLFVLAAGGFALLGSFVWELFELLLNNTSPELAREYSLRSSTVQDGLTDMLAGLSGGLLWAYISYRSYN